MARDALETLRLFMYYSVENTPNGTYRHLNLLQDFVEQCGNKRQSLITVILRVLIKQLISTNFWCLFGNSKSR
jgi:hypothetical protein